MTSSPHRRAIGQLLAAALAWSLGGVLIKFIAWPPLAVAGGRGLIAALVLAWLCRPLRFSWRPLPLAAAVAYAGCTITFVTATKWTTAANAILLQYTAPLYIALAGTWFLGEKAARSDWLTLAVSFCGLLLFFADDLSAQGLAGNLMALLSGVLFAAMTLLMRKQKEGSPVESIILGNTLATVVGLPALLDAPLLPAAGWGALLVLGCVQLGLSYWWYARAIRHATAMEAVLIPVIEPILNPLWVTLLLHERPSPWACAGGALVLGAGLCRAWLALRRPSEGKASVPNSSPSP